MFRNDPTLTLSHLMLSSWKKTFTDHHKKQFCTKIDFADVRRRGWGSIRDRSSYQIG